MAGRRSEDSLGAHPRPPRPKTPAQIDRYHRILFEASALASQLDYESIDMKDVADRAGVAIGTLYRYFPSKKYLIGSVMVDRFRRALERSGQRGVAGETAGTRVYNALARLFWYYEQEPNLVNAILSSISLPDPESAQLFREGYLLQLELIRRAATDGGQVELTPHQERLLDVILDVFNAAVRGVTASDQDASTLLSRIEFVSHLLDQRTGDA